MTALPSHPGQVSVVEAALASDADDSAWARRVIVAAERAQGGAIALEP